MNIVRLTSSLINPAWLASHFARWSPLPLRLIVGYGFMAHGYAKIVKHPENFVAILHALNVPAPHFMAWATIAIELLGGFAIFVGACVPLVSVPMIAVLVVATLTVHLQFGFTSIKLISVTAAGPQFGPPGYETDLLYFACLVALVFGGAGPLAVDNLLPWRKAISPLAVSASANSGEA
jgi:putative oxidoreductase